MGQQPISPMEILQQYTKCYMHLCFLREMMRQWQLQSGQAKELEDLPILSICTGYSQKSTNFKKEMIRNHI
jgi:hypothetical protein